MSRSMGLTSRSRALTAISVCGDAVDVGNNGPVDHRTYARHVDRAYVCAMCCVLHAWCYLLNPIEYVIGHQRSTTLIILVGALPYYDRAPSLRQWLVR